MPTRFSKTRKLRGHVSHGKGVRRNEPNDVAETILTGYFFSRVGKHRKHPGGRGMAGGQHHHRTNLDRFHPGYFGKVGMRHYHMLRNPQWAPTINIDKLWSLVPAEVREQYISGAKTDTAPVIDLLSHGYAKLLGKGRIPEIPIVVRARYVSAEAERKVTEAGGVVELVA